MGAKFLDENGEEKPIIMGSYGIGVERVMACYIEQHNDEYGLVWDKTLAPFHVHLMGLNMKKDEIVQTCDKLYKEMDVLMHRQDLNSRMLISWECLYK